MRSTITQNEGPDAATMLRRAFPHIKQNVLGLFENGLGNQRWIVR
mgnify:CR=1 FL=1